MELHDSDFASTDEGSNCLNEKDKEKLLHYQSCGTVRLLIKKMSPF